MGENSFINGKCWRVLAIQYFLLAGRCIYLNGRFASLLVSSKTSFFKK